MSWSGTLDVARSTYLLTPERLEALRAAGSDGSWDRLSWMDEGKPSEVGAGTVLGGRFLVRDPLGSGSFGQVYQALDEREQRTVAVKVLAPLDEKDQRAARREIAALRVLDLPGVVPFLDSGVVGEQTWVAMELVEGAPFPGYLRGGWDDIAGPTLRLVEALARVHRAGFVHGDLKPMNVLVDREGQPWLLDFGLVRGAYTGCSVDHDGRVGGTPRYLAPEQFYGAHATVQSDLFALGVMLFELLAGRAPFRGVTFAELCASRMMGPPPLEVGPPPASRAGGRPAGRGPGRPSAFVRGGRRAAAGGDAHARACAVAD